MQVVHGVESSFPLRGKLPDEPLPFAGGNPFYKFHGSLVFDPGIFFGIHSYQAVKIEKAFLIPAEGDQV